MDVSGAEGESAPASCFPRPRGATPKDLGGIPKVWDERNGVWRTAAEAKVMEIKAAEAREKKRNEEGESQKARAEHFQVHAELSRGSRRREQASRFEPRFHDGKERAKRPTLHHEDFCFICNDGGELLECTACPRVYHLDCVGLKDVPKGAYYCPWHACWECERKSSNVGGTLFHCLTCPLAYCFDCAPDEYTDGNAVRTAAAAAASVELERKGVASTKSYLFFSCADCVSECRAKPRAPAAASSKKRAAPPSLHATCPSPAMPATVPCLAASSGGTMGGTMLHPPGARVLLGGIEAQPALNGLGGQICHFDSESGRYHVVVEFPGGATKKLALKPSKISAATSAATP